MMMEYVNVEVRVGVKCNPEKTEKISKQFRCESDTIRRKKKRSQLTRCGQSLHEWRHIGSGIKHA